jgi:NADH dehydrogenase
MKNNVTLKSTMEHACKITGAICLPTSKLPRVVVVGGGFARLALVKGLKKKNVQVVLIDRNNFHQFQPLFYQVATSALEPGKSRHPVFFSNFRSSRCHTVAGKQ